MKSHLENASVIRKKQPTNFAQKAKISNRMRKEANLKINEYQKRIDPLFNIEPFQSNLNTYNPSREIEFKFGSSMPNSPNRNTKEMKFHHKSPKARKDYKIKASTNENENSLKQNQINSEGKINENNGDQDNHKIQNDEPIPVNRPKPKYSLFKRNDEWLLKKKKFIKKNQWSIKIEITNITKIYYKNNFDIYRKYIKTDLK